MLEVTNNYFVDETGDTVLFNKKKKPVILGENGASKFFMVGVALIEDPKYLTEQIEILRRDLISDPTLKNIPSMQKTKNFFHAKDDFQAVRREVFHLISRSEIKVNIAIRRKVVLINQAKLLFEQSGKKITAQIIYDDLIRRLFKTLLHKSEKNIIIFSERGKTFSNKSLNIAIQKAQNNLYKSYGIKSHNNHDIKCSSPSEYSGLQIIDYCLWAIQRMYEKKEDYYFNKIKDKFKLIMDLDDPKSDKGYGTWYSNKNELTLDKISIG